MTAITAAEQGAYEYLPKPFDLNELTGVVGRALSQPKARPAASVAEREAAEKMPLIGRSPAMQDIYRVMARLMQTDLTVMVSGASGTGKELVARALHEYGKRRKGPFVAINMAAIPRELIESELFGHEKGSFTGAERRRIGKFEQCKGGTIFLDEVGDMSPLTQSKVLRLLQEQKFERVGGAETIETDVRIISATNRDLEQMIEEGEFRLDLFHRLNGYRIDLPPLRERGDDIELLVDHFLARLKNELGKTIQGVSPEAMKLLSEYPWPGNVRELQAVLRKSVLRATGPVLVPEFLPETILHREPHRIAGKDGELPSDIRRFVDQREQAGSNDLYVEGLEMFERYLLARMLRETDGNQSKAAERLGITRGSLRHKIRALGISIDQVVQPGESKAM
jgi:two-component system nitrogen regulation response regulator GlnG